MRRGGPEGDAGNEKAALNFVEIDTWDDGSEASDACDDDGDVGSDLLLLLLLLLMLIL